MLALRRDLSMLKDMWDPMRTNLGFAPHMFFPLDLCDSYLFPLSNKGYPVNAAVFPDRAFYAAWSCVSRKHAQTVWKLCSLQIPLWEFHFALNPTSRFGSNRSDMFSRWGYHQNDMCYIHFARNMEELLREKDWNRTKKHHETIGYIQLIFWLTGEIESVTMWANQDTWG